MVTVLMMLTAVLLSWWVKILIIIHINDAKMT